MNLFASDPTAAAVLAAVPCYPVPPSGTSPAIDALRAAPSGQGLVVGKDGVMLILRRPWLELDVPIAPAFSAYLPYGSIGAPKADMRCGIVDAGFFTAILDHFDAALPNESAAFVIWNEVTGEFTVDYPAIDEATPSRLIYRTPRVPQGCHIVCDIHSHGRGRAFFSATDDIDDAHATKISMVVGSFGHPEGLTTASRLCAAGTFLPLGRSPFAGAAHAA